MRKVFVFIICTILIVVVCDVLVGWASVNYVKSHSLPGRYEPLDRLIRQVEPDVLLLGNSVMQSAIDPEIVESNTTMSCYNGGILGQDVRFFETMLDCVCQRYTPKYVVLGFRPEELGEGVGDGLYDVLRPYYHTGYPAIDEHFDREAPTEKFLLQSSLYRFNIIWVRILLYSLFDHTDYNTNGFNGLGVPAVLPSMQEIRWVDMPVKRKLDTLESMMAKCQSRGTRMVVCIPPALMHFPGDSLPCVSAVKQLCVRYGVDCWIDYADSEFLAKPSLFADNVHLNVNGAKKYSQIIASRLAHFAGMESQ